MTASDTLAAFPHFALPDDREELRGRRRPGHAKITQIYEGTNQIQRVVMARRLLR